MDEMFCFQCEQTAGCKGCTGKTGVCGKSSDMAVLQDRLTGMLIGLARAVDGRELSERTHKMVIEGFFATLTNVDFDEQMIKAQMDGVKKEMDALSIKESNDHDMEGLWTSDEDIRSLKSLILFGLRGMAAYAYHAMVLGYRDEDVDRFFYEGLAAIGEDWDMERLLPVVMKVGEINLKCMELLDKANTEVYGTPVPTVVPLKVEKGPFIVVTGHDLRDLELLLEQTKDKGVNIYTNGELLPAHAYPKLKAYPHLKGNFGTAWHNQQKEFADIPAPVLFTTNCLMHSSISFLWADAMAVAKGAAIILNL